MISAGEAARGVYGAWRLAHGDRSGLAYFDATYQGFWRSFGAAIVALPAYIGLVIVSMADYEGEINWGGVFLVEGIAYVIDWFAFPLAAVYLCRWVGREANYFLFIVALNWAKVIMAAVMLPAAIVASLAQGTVFAIVPVAIFAAVLVYVWHVTRVSLAVGTAEAIMMTLANLGLGVVVSLWARSLLF
ncbi:MAG: hypothetical protein RL477_1118 [Pseudomonadota bacterium]